MVKGYIYKITCLVNGKVYIGQTVRPLESRLYYHFRDATKRNLNTALCQAIRKYGKENFKIDLVEEVQGINKKLLKHKLDELERKYIKEFDSYLNGYNCTLGGDGTLGFKLSEEHKKKIYRGKGWHHSEETKNKISKKRLGRKLSKETIEKIKEARAKQVFTEEYYKNLRESMKKFRKKVAQYDFDGNLVNIYDSITIASEKTGINDSSISSVCHNKRQSAGGYYWRFVNNNEIINSKIDLQINIRAIEESKPKSVIQYDKNGNVVAKYNSIREASKLTGIVLSSIVETCKGKRRTAGGYIWRYGG